MRGPYNNLKRAIALLGVMLALSAGFLPSHSICDCTANTVATDAVTSSPLQFTCDCGCSLPRDSMGNPSMGQARACSHDKSQHCPCPPNCWCKPISQPWLLTENLTDETRQASFEATNGSAVPRTVTCEVSPSRQASLQKICCAANSSVSRCAQLCRFII